MVREKPLVNHSGKTALNHISQAIETVGALGLASIWHYAQYQVYLKSGAAQKLKPTRWEPDCIDHCLGSFQPLFIVPTKESLKDVLGKNQEILLGEANELCAGQFHPFGGPAQSLRLSPPKPLLPWTQYGHQLNGEDIKLWWEPARLGWVFVLGRAFILTGKEKYAATCIRYLSTFMEDNPPYIGPNWSSAQEAALRIPAFIFALQVFDLSPSLTKDIRCAIVQSILTHAERIPPTLHYAHAQRNNHLLSESLGLVLAATAFPHFKQSADWMKTGERTFNAALLDQIDPESGEYIQHSVNYHRLMLHLALLWARSLHIRKEPIPEASEQRLRQAVSWLKDKIDSISGQASNLGHNDGSNLLRLDSESIESYNPVLQTSARAFCSTDFLGAGPWDEPMLWLGLTKPNQAINLQPYQHSTRLDRSPSWASIRVMKFTSRPAHADQAHMDLWLDGFNIACDPGTYHYNADPPWDNSLASAVVHNTITVGDREPMLRASRFLWLRWSSAILYSPSDSTGCIRVVHDTRHGGWKHVRDACWTTPNELVVTDHVSLIKPNPQQVTLHWLLADAHWEWQEPTFHLFTPKGNVTLTFNAMSSVGNQGLSCQVIRAGETLMGENKAELFGWRSPTYGVRVPALSVRVSTIATKEITLRTTWQVPSIQVRD